jgi:hypothetical protein
MKLRCAICGRVTLFPACFIGSEPIGPTCARKTGIARFATPARRVGATAPRSRRGGMSTPHGGVCPATRDLFEGIEA